MEIRSDTRVADLATEHPATIRVFQRHGIDFCCGGKRPLVEVCDELGLSLGDVRRDLDLAVAAPREETPPWRQCSLRAVIAGILERYHRPLAEELPRLDQMMDKVLRVHGQRHPELVRVNGAFGTIRNELRPHMDKEEQMLFPYIARLEGVALGGAAPDAAALGCLTGPIAAMEADHEDVGRALAELRAHTSGFRAPEDACNTFRGLYHGLQELERGLHEHIHVENNVLFPRAVRLEAELQAGDYDRSAIERS